MVHEPDLVVGVRIPRSIDLQRTGGLPAVGVAQVHRDTAVLAGEFADHVEGRPAVEEVGEDRVQAPTRDQQQREAGAGYVVTDPHIASFIKARTGRFLPVLGESASRGGDRGSRGSGLQKRSPGRIHVWFVSCHVLLLVQPPSYVLDRGG